MPFFVHWHVTANFAEEHPRGLLTAGVSVVGLVILVKVLQVGKGGVLREPIRKSGKET